jgi:hypothetical protein
VRLPSHLDWSGNAEYGLDTPARVAGLYRAVLIEAAGPRTCMPTWMPGVNGQVVLMATDTGVLRRLWALIWLPAALSAHAPGSRYSCTGYPCMTDS